MSIRYEAIFEYKDVESENLRRALSALAQQIRGSTMPEVRRLVCAHAQGSYSLLSEALALKEMETISLSQRQAEMLMGIAGAIAQQMPETDSRKLRTWMGSLINDMDEAAERESKQEKNIGKPGSMAHAS